MFWQNMTKIGQIYIPNKLTQSRCIGPKIKYKILAQKGLRTTHATPGDYLAPLKLQTNGIAGPSDTTDDGSRFPGRSKPLQTGLFYLNCSVEH